MHLDTVLYWELSASSMLYALTFRPPLLAWFGLDIDGGERKDDKSESPKALIRYFGPSELHWSFCMASL